MLYYWHSWADIKEFEAPHYFVPAEKVSIIIPARNEEKNIARLLDALLRQTYPRHLTEIIVADDHSTDDTAKIAAAYPGIKLISLQADAINSYKKKAIATGIAGATGTWIITTDADCIPPDNWLTTLMAFRKQKEAIFIAAPVLINPGWPLVRLFQSLDFMVLQGITGAAVAKGIHSMCNGANMGYSQEVYEAVGGFEGIDHIASGDDMLLMHKIWRADKSHVYYLKAKDAIVSTAPVAGWRAFFQQRIRWASKAPYYTDKRIFAALLLVYLFNLSFLLLFAYGFWDYRCWIALLAGWVAKTVAELPLFTSISLFFLNKSRPLTFFLLQPLHIAYVIISGLLGQRGGYEWKGRKVK